MKVKTNGQVELRQNKHGSNEHCRHVRCVKFSLALNLREGNICGRVVFPVLSVEIDKRVKVVVCPKSVQFCNRDVLHRGYANKLTVLSEKTKGTDLITIHLRLWNWNSVTLTCYMSFTLFPTITIRNNSRTNTCCVCGLGCCHVEHNLLDFGLWQSLLCLLHQLNQITPCNFVTFTIHHINRKAVIYIATTQPQTERYWCNLRVIDSVHVTFIFIIDATATTIIIMRGTCERVIAA